MPLELVTTKDLQNFKIEMLKEFKLMLSKKEPIAANQLLKSGEVRKLLRISQGTLQNLRRNETLNCTRIGGIIYYFYEDIEKLMKRRGE